MYLRNLKINDATLMLEWMSDTELTDQLFYDFSKYNILDCITFIEKSWVDNQNMHKAIVSEKDEYLGTVSLKHIDSNAKTAEFAIVLRKSSIGKGIAWYGMKEILNYAFDKLKLRSIYWCVRKNNLRACKFYDKHGFFKTYDIPEQILSRYEDIENLIWYSVLSGDDLVQRQIFSSTVLGGKLVPIKTIPTIDSGELSFLESDRDVPFEIKRIYYISKVPFNVTRGFHAHKNLKQLLFCVYGKIQITIDDGNTSQKIILSDPAVGILIERPVWREMKWVKKDSVLMVVASEFYEVEDYIRDYNSFLEFLDKERINV